MTMNASAPATPAAPAAPSNASGGGASARAAALKASLEAVEGPATSEPTVESSATPPREASSAVDSGAAAPAGPDPERAARLARVRQRDEQERQRRQQQQANHANDGEIEKLRKRVAELEPLNAVFASEESLFGEAEKRGWSSEKVVAYLRKRLTDPAAVAQQASKSEADKVREELAKEREAREKLEADIKNERERTAAEREQTEKTASFLTSARAKTETHPRTARALAKWTEAGLITFVNHTVAPHLPERYDTDHLHDLLEDYFEKTEAFGGTAPTPEVAPARPPTKNGAGQPATTISNALTSGRGTVVEEIPLHKLPLDERKARLKAKLERE